MIGTRIGHYALIAKLGEGGMGEVYRATDTKLGRDVALKMLPSAMSGDADRLSRFRREAITIAALNHPNIVTIFSVEEAEGVHFLTMELVEGQTLVRSCRWTDGRSNGCSSWRSRSPMRSPARMGAASCITISSPPT